MNIATRALALSALAFAMGHTAQAAEKPTNIDVISCTRYDGSVLTHNVYAYTFSSGASNPRYFSVYFAGTLFNTYLDEEYFGSGFTSCKFAGLSGTTPNTVSILDVSSMGVGMDVDGGSLAEDGISQRYTLVTFSYTFLFVGTVSGAIKSSALPTGTAEQQAAALAAFKARGLALPRR